jgi:hypothetical protein
MRTKANSIKPLIDWDLGSYFLFLQEQIKDIIIMMSFVCSCRNKIGAELPVYRSVLETKIR